MHITGRCHCGAITFEAELNPEKVGICHCTDCQQMSASAYRFLAIVAGDDLRLLTGTPKEYIKTGDSGARRVQAFCADCGAGLYATAADGPREAFNLRAGTIDQRRDLRPHFEIFCTSALPWTNRIEGAAHHDRMP